MLIFLSSLSNPKYFPLCWCRVTDQQEYFRVRSSPWCPIQWIHLAHRSDKAESPCRSRFVWSKGAVQSKLGVPGWVCRMAAIKDENSFFKVQFWQMVWSTFQRTYLASVDVKQTCEKHGYTHAQHANSFICQHKDSTDWKTNQIRHNRSTCLAPSAQRPQLM